MSEAGGRGLRSERLGRILVVTIDRPQARNAMDAAASAAMSAAMDELEADPDLFLGVITGAGGTFCAGTDLKAVAASGVGAIPPRGRFGLCERPPAKPLIAAVEGYAVGGGLEICLACDLIVAASDAKLGLPEVRHNLVAIAGGAFRLPRRIPYHLAMELALSGQLREAGFFHQHGMINRLTEPGRALDGALELVDLLLANGPTALAATAQIMRRSSDWSDEEAWREQARLAARAAASQDRAEGLKAFVEKRKPNWTGR